MTQIHEGVVLLHGIFRTKRCMAGIERLLQKNGYDVLNLSYPSTRFDLASLTQQIAPAITEFALQVSCVHFVGFSMGGLLIRAYLKAHRPGNLGRVVMLGTPNKGSHMADMLQRWKLYRLLWGPAGQQLGTDQNSIQPLFGPVDFELGIIAGNRTVDPISLLAFDTPHDGRVAVEHTKLDGMRDHLVLKLPHVWLPASRSVKQKTLNFLKNGVFKDV